MARCEDCLHFEVCQALEQGNGIMRVHPLYCGFYKPTADVVPRAELAREIFGEMDEIFLPLLHEVSQVYIYVQLKKKYTEAHDETRN